MKALIFGAFFFFITFCGAQVDTLLLSSTDLVEVCAENIIVLKGGTGPLGVKKVVSAQNRLNLSPGVVNLGITEDDYWLYLPLKLEKGEKLLLDIQQPDLDFIEVFEFSQGEYSNLGKAGENFPFRKRLVAHHHYLFELNRSAGPTKLIVLHVQSNDQMIVPLRIGPYDAFFRKDRVETLLFGLMAGGMIVMIFYNFFIFLFTREKVYVVYVIYGVFILLTQSSILGFPNHYVWSHSIWLTKSSVSLFSCLVGLSAMEFQKRFLETRTHVPKLHKLGYFISTSYGVNLILVFLGELGWAYRLILVNAGCISLYMLLVASISIRRNVRDAWSFLAAWSVLLIGIFVYVLKDFGFLPANTLTTYMMPFGAGLEMVVLSLALGNRLKMLQADRERIVKNQNTLLETKVKERTEELESLYENLKEARSKMATLGELTAGIAHDLNNPLSRVAMTLPGLRSEISAMGNQAQAESFGVEDSLFLLTQLEESVTSMNEVVQRLKEYSRPSVDKIEIHFEEVIRDNLALLDYELRGVDVRIELELLPSIQGIRSQLDRVFINLFRNALEAMKDSENTPQLRIIGHCTEDGIMIEVADNGPGVPEDVGERIFEPFYTTKRTGTGLGLSEIKPIMSRHGGKVTLESGEKGAVIRLIFQSM